MLTWRLGTDSYRVKCVELYAQTDSGKAQADAHQYEEALDAMLVMRSLFAKQIEWIAEIVCWKPACA